MGTSISHPSPKNTSWKPLDICYSNENIPENRVVKEIWRASESESNPISNELKTDTIYSIYKTIENSQSARDAYNRINEIIAETKSNSMVAEFAKRSVFISYESDQPAESWTRNFFSELTKYFMSRDLSGYVGESYRNKNIKDLIAFKERLSGIVSDTVRPHREEIKTYSQWKKFITNSIDKLKAL